jgi:hypothetical protein
MNRIEWVFFSLLLKIRLSFISLSSTIELNLVLISPFGAARAVRFDGLRSFTTPATMAWPGHGAADLAWGRAPFRCNARPSPPFDYGGTGGRKRTCTASSPVGDVEAPSVSGDDASGRRRQRWASMRRGDGRDPPRWSVPQIAHALFLDHWEAME